MNAPIEASPVSQDDRLMGGLSHIFGLIVAIIIWATQKEKKFVAFQAMQAIAFDIVVSATFLVFGICMFCGMFGSFGLMFPASFGLAATSQEGGQPSGPLAIVFILVTLLTTLLPFGLMAVFMLIALGVLAVRIYAGISVISGRDFRYPILGAWLERYLARQAQ